jgi:hypothetical protein
MRVDGVITVANLEMDMRAGGMTGVPQESDERALLDHARYWFNHRKYAAFLSALRHERGPESGSHGEEAQPCPHND